MKLDAASVLNISAAQLMGAIAPQLPPGYPQASASLTGFLLTFCAQELDRAADIRAKENRDMRALFAALGPRVTDAELKVKLGLAAVGTDTSLTISALDAANAELRCLLITLHEALDADSDANARIWRLLRDMADRRILKLPGA
jgi:hypothetical protein